MKDVKSTSEFNLFLIVDLLRNNVRKLVKTVSVFFVLGLVFAITSPVEFETSMVVLPEESEGMNTGGLLDKFGSLPGLSSFSFGSGNTISPELYDQIISSKSFLYDLMHQKIKFSEQDSISYRVYEENRPWTLVGFLKEYTVGLIGKVKGLISEEEISESVIINQTYKLTKEEIEMMEYLSQRITVEIDEIEGLVTIKGKMPTPIASASLVELVYENLKDFIINYKLAKANRTIEYLEDQAAMSNENFIELEDELQRFYKSYNNLRDPQLQFQKENLEFSYQSARDLYFGIIEQLTQVRLDKQKKLPEFTVVKPIVVPVEKSEPKRLIILILFSVIGVFLFVSGLLAKQYYNRIKEQYNQYQSEQEL